jgi:hypothetical protein
MSAGPSYSQGAAKWGCNASSSAWGYRLIPALMSEGFLWFTSISSMFLLFLHSLLFPFGILTITQLPHWLPPKMDLYWAYWNAKHCIWRIERDVASSHLGAGGFHHFCPHPLPFQDNEQMAVLVSHPVILYTPKPLGCSASTSRGTWLGRTLHLIIYFDAPMLA